MKVNIVYKNVKHSDELDEHIRRKSSKLKKFFRGKFYLNWTCEQREGVHYVNLHFQGPTIEYKAKGVDSNLYKSFELAMGKIERQVSKKKNKWKDHIHHKHESAVVYLDPEFAWFGHDEDEFDDVG